MVRYVTKREGYTWLKGPIPTISAFVTALPNCTLPSAEEYLKRFAHKYKWAQVVLEYGTTYPLKPLGSGLYPGMLKKRCFMNSLVMATQGTDLGITLRYAEGVAIYPYKALLHSWNTDGISALDFTWRIRKAHRAWKYHDPLKYHEYFGVEFDTDFVFFMVKRGAHTDQPSILHNAGTAAWPEVVSYLRSQASRPRTRP